MKKFNKIFVIDGITNGIVKIVRKTTTENLEEYFNVYMTAGFERTDCCCDNPHVSLTKEDTIKLLNNVKNKKITFIGINPDVMDEVIEQALDMVL
jgi:hypothetical protein